ncbi:MAG: PepSY domain-containing protein [Gordonia sp. (in: high G+C Gram-positive bacteria)]|uniref:PepSY-associated TM helix domain-containing protein n=1 Tax=Gordonia sp. (in: high G+C Gram-positive bacteria) TaxID=84139 RepID=UPI0039E64A65
MSPTMRLLRRLHFYAGIVVGPFLLVAAITGGLYAIAPTAEKMIYRSELHTDSTGTPRSLADQVDAAHAVHPDLPVDSVLPAPKPGDTTRVLFTDPSLPESTMRAVFVDPATLRITGDLPVFGSSWSLPMRTWLDGLHRNLNLGVPGRFYSEFAASWLWVIALAGVALWISAYRKKRRARGEARLLSVDRSTDGRSRSMNWHAVTGMWIVVALLFLSATGLTWSRFAGAHVTDLRSALDWTQPTVDASLTDQPAPTGGEHAGHDMAGMPGMSDDPAPQDTVAARVARAEHVDGALGLARSVGVGTGSAVQITVPADDHTGYTVSEVRAPWQFSPDTAVVDPAAGRVVSVDHFRSWPLAAKLANWGIAVHMGVLFGIANQLVLLVVALALAAMIVFGYRMWWQRRPRGSRRPGRAPARGALRELPWPAVAGIAVVAVGVGWFIPLLGWPLLAFLVFDVLVAGWQRFRPGGEPAAASAVDPDSPEDPDPAAEREPVAV